ncbi:MAG: isoaspartyl peptidase/L-asparaginase [Desulfurococcaceae archaeon]
MIHGGAGAWRDEMLRSKAIGVVKACVEKGWEMLDEKGSLDAVVESVKCMEDSGYLNAGYGSVLDLLGGRSLDAGLMTSTGLIGAVASVKATRNPILLAKIVAEKTPHIIITGEYADLLAILNGLPPLPPPPPHVLERYRQMAKKLLEGGEDLGDYYKSLRSLVGKMGIYKTLLKGIVEVYDTVGAVAIDDNDILSAATSTGGVALKLPGRVGDTPIPGAGFYASDLLACSSTGIGEYIIRTMPCMRLDMVYRNVGHIERALGMVMEYIDNIVGKGSMGLIGIDRHGNAFYAYNTEAMLISYIGDHGDIVIEYKPEPGMRVWKIAK